jgi:thiaminase
MMTKEKQQFLIQRFKNEVFIINNHNIVTLKNVELEMSNTLKLTVKIEYVIDEVNTLTNSIYTNFVLAGDQIFISEFHNKCIKKIERVAKNYFNHTFLSIYWTGVD